MPRQPRQIAPGEHVHTIIRSIDNSFLYEGSSEQNILLRALKRIKDRYATPIYAWVGMSNHHHVLNQAPTEWPKDNPNYGTGRPCLIGNALRDGFSMFARWLNEEKGRMGGVVRDRARTVPVQTDHQALTLLIYIFLNPVRAGIVNHPREYKFHNYRMYAEGKSEHAGLFSHHPSYLALGNTWAKRRHRFQKMVEAALREWAQKRWPGISASNGKGMNQRKNQLENFRELARTWIPFVLLQGQGPPGIPSRTV